MPSRQIFPARLARLLVPLALGCLLVAAGCGAHQTQHGAPPYQPSSSPASTAIPSNYPKDDLKFTFPKTMAADQRIVALAYVAFQRAYIHALHDGRVGAELKQVATDAVVAQIRRQVTGYAKGGVDTPHTTVRISQIVTSAKGAVVGSCVVTKGTRSPLAALMAPDVETGDLQVTTLAKDTQHHLC